METFLFTIDYKQRQAFPFWHKFVEAITLTKDKKANVTINKYEYSPWYWTTDQSCIKGIWDFLHLSLSALFTHTRTQLFHNAASVLFTTAYQLLPIRNRTMWWMMLFQKWSLERTCLWSEFKHPSSQVSACQKKPTIEMVLSFTGETENQACGGQDGGNDCLWWCFKVCVFLCLLVLFFHFAFGYLKDVLILPNIVLLFLLWMLYIKLCQSFPSPNLVYSIMPPAHIEAENKQKGQKFWCVKTEVCRQACFINEIITLTKSTTISNSIFNNRMTNSQLQHILNLLWKQKAQYQMFTVWQWNTPFSNYFRKCCQHFVKYRRKYLTAPHKIKKFGNIFASFLLSQLRLKSVSRRSEEWCVGCPDHLFAPGNIKKKAKR